MTLRRGWPLMLVLALAACGGGRPRPVPPAPVADGAPLGTLPRQALAEGQCGLFLWTAGEGARLVLMANSGPPPFARIVLDGRTTDLPRLPDAAGSEANARYGDGRTAVALDLALEPREGLSDGALAGGTLRIDRVDGEGLALPVTGLLGCG